MISSSFLKLVAFRVQLVFSYQITAVVVGWHIYELTHDPWSLGLIGLAEVLPYFSCALFAGYAVDRYSRYWFGVLSAAILSINGLLLMAVANGYFDGDPTRWIYGAIIFVGIARSFIAPTYNALFALILPREQFARAAGISTSALQVGLVLGPALGGVLVGWAGKAIAYGTAAALCLSAMSVLLLLRVNQPPLSLTSTPMLKSIAEGLQFVRGNQVMLAAMSLDMLAVLFGGTVAMLPAFIQDVFHAGAEGLGILRTAPAIGAVLTGTLLVRYPLNEHAGRWLLLAVAGFGICMIMFALSTHFWLAALILMISGMFDGVSIVLRTTILQLVTPDNMRGRVSAINGIFIGSSNELGAFESGLAARLIGLVPSVIFGGTMTLAVVAVIAKLSPSLRRLNLSQLQ